MTVPSGSASSSDQEAPEHTLDESTITNASRKTALSLPCEGLEPPFSDIVNDYRTHKSTRLFVSQAVGVLDWSKPVEQVRKLNEILPKGETVLVPHSEDGSVDMLVMTTPSEGEIFVLRDSLQPPPCRTTTELRAIFSLSKDKVDQIFMGLPACWASCTVELIQLEIHISLSRELPDGKTYRRRCMHYLRLLSMKHRVLPPSFNLNDIVPEGQHPVWGGGFADVWRGNMGGQPVCLKVLRFFTTRTRRDKLIKQLCREALAWRQLSHLNVLPFLGVSTELFAPSFCLVSPWMRNGNLMVYLEANPDFDRLKALLEVAEAMLYLHEQDPSVVHGDIRGANILVTDDLRCCLSDFGLATVVESQALDSSSVNNYGSVRWMAPELLMPTTKAKDNDPARPSRSVRDIYAFGCTFLEIWTGKPPFHDCAFEIAVSSAVVAGQRPTRPPQILSDDLWSLIERCWAQDPLQRPSAQEIVLSLRPMVFPPSDISPTEEGPLSVVQLNARLQLDDSHALDQALVPIAITSLPSRQALKHRELIRAATSMLCSVIFKLSFHVTGSEHGDWEEVEIRIRPLARLERIWSKFSLNWDGYPVGNGINTVGEERERRRFCEALQDGYVLCYLMNKLRSSSIIKPDARKDVFARSANVSNFLAACSLYGLPGEDLFHHDDFIEATPTSLSRVAKTIITLIKFAESLGPPPGPDVAIAPSVGQGDGTIDDLFIQFLLNLPTRRLLHDPTQVAVVPTSIEDQPVVTSHRRLSSSSISHLPLASTRSLSPRRRSLDSSLGVPRRPSPGLMPREAPSSLEPIQSSSAPFNKIGTISTVATKGTSEVPSIPDNFPDIVGQQLVEDVSKTKEIVPVIRLGRGKWPDDFIPRVQPADLSSGSKEPSYSTPPIPRSPPRKLAIVGQRRNESLEPLPQYHRRPHTFDTPVPDPAISRRFAISVDAQPQQTTKTLAHSVDASPVTSPVRKALVIREEGNPPTHFQLGNCIGTGQFGSVYRALNLNTGQMVAVKLIRLEGLKEEEITTLMTEVDLVKSLSHPNIIKYKGMARDNDTLSIVLEYAENGSLAQTLKAFGKLNERLVASYVVRILEGLHYLHQCDVVHCDLKASNILSMKNGDVKLSDFGVSLNMRAMERDIKDVAGTPNWMAPEVIELKGASPKSDIWSLACTVIELLTGRPPYADVANSMSVMFRIVEDDMPSIPDGCSPLLRDFLTQCFDKDPTKRPSAEILCEHEWLKKNLPHHKELRPQDSIPFLRRVGTEVPKSDAVRSPAQVDMAESSAGSPPEKEHTFVKTTFSKPMICRICLQNVKKSAVLCTQCSLVSHSKCAANAPPTCDLRAQLLLLAQYAQRSNHDSPRPSNNESLPALAVPSVERSPRTSLVVHPSTPPPPKSPPPPSPSVPRSPLPPSSSVPRSPPPPSSPLPGSPFKFLGAFKKLRRKKDK